MKPRLNYEALSEPFDRKFIDTVRKGSRSESYVNHAVVTDRLNVVAPGWTSELLHIETYITEGIPHCAGVTLRLTVSGLSRDEVGTVGRASNYGDEIKACMSDALKRAAMRFGVGIQLWHDLPLRRSATLPVSSAETGAGAPATPVPSTSGVAERTGDKTGARGASPDWGAEPNAELASSGETSTGKGTPPEVCSSYADHTFKKQDGELVCSKCGVTRT